MLQGRAAAGGVLTLLYLIHIGSSLFYYSLVSGEVPIQLFTILTFKGCTRMASGSALNL
jgi:hypothetical protein